MCFGLNCFQNCWDLIKHTFLWPYLAPIHDYRIFVSLCTHWWLCVCQHFLAKLLLCLLIQNLWGPLQLPTSIYGICLTPFRKIPSKMNVDLKFVFRSIVQVYQRYFNIHSYVSLIRRFCSLSWWGSLQAQILRDIWRKRWILICTTKNKEKLQGSGDPQGNSAWGPISASSSFDSLPLLHQGR